MTTWIQDYFKVTIIKQVWNLHANEYTDKWYRIQSPEKEPHQLFDFWQRSKWRTKWWKKNNVSTHCVVAIGY